MKLMNIRLSCIRNYCNTLYIMGISLKGLEPKYLGLKVLSINAT